MKKLARISMLVFAAALTAANAHANTPQDEILKRTGLEKRLGALAALDTRWQNSEGETIMFNSLFNKKPVVLVPVYYTCPMLCQLVLRGLVKGLNQMDMRTEKDFDLIVYSINPDEKPKAAAKKKEEFLKEYTGKHIRDVTFLTGGEDSIRKLSKSIGFKYEKDPASGEYVHSAALLFLSPEGKIMRYMGGIDFNARDVKLALIEAANGKVGSFWDQILLVCYHYDPTKGKYSMAVDQILRGIGGVTVLCLAWFIISSLRNDKIGRGGQPA